MQNLNKSLAESLKKEIGEFVKKSPSETSVIIKTIFQALVENSCEEPKKLKELKANSPEISSVVNSLLSATVSFAGENTLSEEIASVLSESGLEAKFVKQYSEGYEKYRNYMESAQGLQEEGLAIGRTTLLDFKWEMRKRIFTTDKNTPQDDLVIGEFLLLDNWTGKERTFKCLIPSDMVDKIARECETAVNSVKNSLSKEASSTQA